MFNMKFYIHDMQRKRLFNRDITQINVGQWRSPLDTPCLRSFNTFGPMTYLSFPGRTLFRWIEGENVYNENILMLLFSSFLKTYFLKGKKLNINF